MREIAGAVAVLGGLVFVLLIAIRGFRPGSGSPDGRTSSARSASYLQRYRARSRMAVALTALPAGWALGETVSATASSFVIALVLGVFVGALLSLGSVGVITAQIIGGLGLLVSIERVANLENWEVRHRVILIACAVVVALASVAASAMVTSFRTWGLIAVMTGVKMAVFGVNLQADEFSTPSLGMVLGLVLMCVVGIPMLASVAPTLVLPLCALGLVVTKAMIDIGVLDGRSESGVGIVIAAGAATVGARWLGAVAEGKR